jgi:hypothetical protein
MACAAWQRSASAAAVGPVLRIWWVDDGPSCREVIVGSERRPTAGPPTRRLPRIVIETRADGVYAVAVEV